MRASRVAKALPTYVSRRPLPPSPTLIASFSVPPPFPRHTAHCCQVLQAADWGRNKTKNKNRHITRRQLQTFPSAAFGFCFCFPLAPPLPASGSASSPSHAVIKVCITFYCSLKRFLCTIRRACTHMVPLPASCFHPLCPLPAYRS